MLNARKEEAFCTILREELQLATGCTEPIAVAYCAARLRQVLGERPQRILAEVSGNILKNVKSVVVPNTGGRRGLPAAIAVGVVAGDPEARLQVIAHVTEEDTAAIQAYLDSTDIRIDCPPTPRMLDIRLTGWAGDHKAVVHVANNHTNIIYVERDGEVLLEKPHSDSAEDNLQDKSVLNVRDILTFAETVDVSRIEESVGRQIDCNTAIAREGLQGDWGANIGSTLLLSGGDVETEARAWAAACSTNSTARFTPKQNPALLATVPLIGRSFLPSGCVLSSISRSPCRRGTNQVSSSTRLPRGDLRTRIFLSMRSFSSSTWEMMPTSRSVPASCCRV